MQSVGRGSRWHQMHPEFPLFALPGRKRIYDIRKQLVQPEEILGLNLQLMNGETGHDPVGTY